MIVSEPKIDQRKEQAYMGIRSTIPVTEMPNFIPQSIDAVFSWLGKQGVESVGAPFLRYHVIDMADKMDLEIGVPVAKTVPGDEQVKPGTLPAGRYASLVYRDVTKGYESNKVLIDWATEKGIAWDRWDDPNGDAFAGRYERFLSGPQDDPSPSNWDTEVAIKLKD